ncbi:type 1 glutamine amidotransferase [Cohnella fermenti]|uniref:Type 1 glutamine amidotransferase n=1 Tax=Cohnella fermenti TaxID=2565925 RepID=A0A4S4CDT4_9BACL|nr:type 1 glutamine amidotransferase [Cohnella fermenti]THF84138.1 type 1 glutamine amidotransferase [Cohnella fermenti]
MDIVIVKHFDFDDESAITEWAASRGHSFTVVDPSGEGSLPDTSAFELLIILGGPMSVYEEEAYPWLAEEKSFIRKAIDADKKLLGICLGGQLLAEVLGGQVFRSEHKELGFHPLRLSGNEHPLFAGMPDGFHSYQWHGDAFELPAEALLLASSEACRNQAFAYGPRILGLQFHLETTRVCAETMLDRWRDELVDAPYIQSAEAIRGQWSRVEDSHGYLRDILDRFEQA